MELSEAATHVGDEVVFRLKSTDPPTYCRIVGTDTEEWVLVRLDDDDDQAEPMRTHADYLELAGD